MPMRIPPHVDAIGVKLVIGAQLTPTCARSRIPDTSRRLMRFSSLPMGLALLLASAVVRTARAEPERDELPVAGAFLAGAATALIPLGVGASIIVSSQGHSSQNTGVAIVESGFVLAPLLSHAVVGEWKRGALFSIAPAIAAMGMATLLQTNPDVVNGGKLQPQYLFVGAFVATMFSSSFGVVDVFGANDRAFLRKVTVTPVTARGELGLGVGGLF